ncbi:MAG: CHAT domain-containing protein, partial [Candidatus Eisenbacteria sp.]|nr:CHAT domain-containing protein [Candidatus Eisenbacteria bacterium]
VTLSACGTALGKRTGGEGHIGLAQAFLQAGARCLLVSLWKVKDSAAALLMERFYRNLCGDGSAQPGAARSTAVMSKAAALREAKHWLRTYTDADGHQPFRHPANWSAFVLIGEAG